MAPYNKNKNKGKETRSINFIKGLSIEKGDPIAKIENGGRKIGQANNEYLLGRTLGEGTFGKVKLGTHILTGEKVAIKVLDKSRIVELADVRRVTREIKILKRNKHPNIIQLYEVVDSPSFIYLIMEYCDGGEMYEYIVSHQRIQEPKACWFFHQVIDAVDYFHCLEITHRDLKPENLLLQSSINGWIVKIVDFGLSNFHEGGVLLSTACGSPCYASPEMISGKKYWGPKSDIWSLGVILFAMVCGYLPFEDSNISTLYKQIIRGDYTLPRWVSASFRDFMSHILATDPNERYSVEEIRQHPWYVHVVNPLRFEEDDPNRFNQGVLSQLSELGISVQHVLDDLNAEGHTYQTAAYHLLLKRQRRNKEKNDFFLGLCRPGSDRPITSSAPQAPIIPPYQTMANSHIKASKTSSQHTRESPRLSDHAKELPLPVLVVDTDQLIPFSPEPEHIFQPSLSPQDEKCSHGYSARRLSLPQISKNEKDFKASHWDQEAKESFVLINGQKQKSSLNEQSILQQAAVNDPDTLAGTLSPQRPREHSHSPVNQSPITRRWASKLVEQSRRASLGFTSKHVNDICALGNTLVAKAPATSHNTPTDSPRMRFKTCLTGNDSSRPSHGSRKCGNSVEEEHTVTLFHQDSMTLTNSPRNGSIARPRHKSGDSRAEQRVGASPKDSKFSNFFSQQIRAPTPVARPPVRLLNGTTKVNAFEWMGSPRILRDFLGKKDCGPRS